MSPATEALKFAVLAAMPAPPAWATAKQIFKLLDFGAYHTVRNVLNDLVVEGKLVKFGPVDEPAYQRCGVRPSAALKKKMVVYRKNLEEWKAKP